MIEIFEKRGQWCFNDASGKLHKFATEVEAKAALGYKEPVLKTCECEDCDCDPCECELEDVE